jgi:hypothetical protein
MEPEMCLSKLSRQEVADRLIRHAIEVLRLDAEAVEEGEA